MPSTETESPIRISISKDRVRAYLSVADIDPESINSNDIVAKLNKSNIPITPEITKRINDVLEQLKSGQSHDEQILIVEGRDPVPGASATFEFAEPDPEVEDSAGKDDKVNYYRSQILTVQEGAVIGKLTPEIQPQPGQDVYGKPIKAEKPKPPIQLGKNVKLAGDGETVIAAKTGMVHLTRHQIDVLEVVEIDGNVDFSTGNIDSPIDVLIRGTVLEGFKVESANSVTVQHTIEAADVKAGTDVHVHGGIVANRKCTVIAGGEIFSKFCEDANLQAENDITISRSSLNSNIYTGGLLLVPNGSVIGGYLYACQGAEIRELGNEANIRTEIAVGIDPVILAEARRTDRIIKKKQETAANIRTRVQPLIANFRRLDPKQRKRATELIHEAERLDNEVRELEKNKKAAIAAKSPPPDCEPTLQINAIIFPGVRVICGDKMVVISKERKGHFKITRRVVNRVEEIVIVDQISGSVTTLPSYEYIPSASTTEPQPCG